MQEKVILSGFGGQGILSAGLMIAESAVLDGLNATYFPSYGAEMRGGTANCHVIFGSVPISSPIITKADTLITLNKASLDKFSDWVREGGLILVNSSAVKNVCIVPGCRMVSLPVDELALEKLGSPRMANVIMIGAYLAASGLLKADAVRKAIMEKFGKKGQKIVDQNFKALELGMNAVKS